MAQKPKCGAFFECENQEKHPEAFFVYHCGNCMACIDLKNPKTNQKNAGFLPEERAWMVTTAIEAAPEGFSVMPGVAAYDASNPASISKVFTAVA